MTINFNIPPYNDDFDENKGFYKILFNPSRAVQARELTQLQTILSTQNKVMLEHFFEEGSMIIPGQIAYDSRYSYVKVETQYLSADINVNNFLNKEITGQTSGVKALVINVAPVSSPDPNTLFIKYLNSGTNGTQATFSDGELLETNDDIPFFVSTISSDATGFGSAANIQEGWYFVNGLLAKVVSQSLVLDKYTNYPSYKVGLEIQSSIVNAGQDTSLLDNALGSPNQSAPGADRFKVELVLTKRAIDGSEDDENFIELLRLDNGEILKKVVSTEYALLEDTLARRTFEESGNYTVKDFKLDVREHLLSGNNRGKYTVAQGGSEAKLALGIEPGIAYVNGYRIQTTGTRYIDVNKSRATRHQNNGNLNVQLGQFVVTNNIESIPNFTSYPEIDLQNAVTVTPGTAAGTKIGTARIRGIELNSGIAGSGTETYRIYLFDIKMNASQNFSAVRQLYLAGAVPFTTDIVLASSDLAEISQAARNVSIFRFPNAPIQSVRATDLSVDTLYTVKRVFEGTTSSLTISFNAGVNEIFDSFNPADWLLTVTSGDDEGEVINLIGKVTIQGTPTGKEALIDLSGDLSGDASVRLIAPIFKQVAQEKTKTLQTDTNQFTTPTATMILSRADVFRVTGIFDSEDPGVNAVNTDLNITDRYNIDSGQRDNFYDRGRISLKSGQSAPTGRVLVEFEYFSHGAGDYFSVDSYSGQIPYVDIPSFTSSNGSVYDLRNCLDFRPRINNAGTGFTGTGASNIEQVKPNSNIIADYFYYLNRIDKLAVDERGDFVIIQGIPDITPKPPSDLDNALSLYQLSIRAYTFSTNDVITDFIDNRRYTMKDIGRLERRIENLEYYTSLSLLEKETAAIQVVDPITGLNRFKNGFIVDGFNEHGVGDVLSPDYRCAIDRARKELRPPFNEQNATLEFVEGSSSHFQKTGDLITLPYTKVPFITQPYASRIENVNPYAIFTFLGSIQLNPETDFWKDTERQPDLNVNLPDNVDVISQIANASGFTGTQWNSWQDQWAGANRVVDQSVSSTKVTGPNVNEFGQGWPIRFDTTTRTTFAQEVGQTRTGVNTTIVPRTVRTSIGDRVVAVELIPFMRSIPIQFTGTRLRPQTRVYPFFDDEAVSQFCRPLSGVNNDPLITDANGKIEGIFTVPNTDAIRFRTGERVFRLTSSATDLDDNTTAAQARFVAQGLIETQQETILSTRVAQVDQRSVSENRTITRVSQTTNVETGEYFDPLAQTFINEERGGCYVTDIDLFFRTKSESIPVTVQLRSVVNGYPGPFVFPFGEVTLNPEDVNISEDSTVATKFTFPSPVYLIPNVEYCFVILSDSIDYECYVARIGENQVGTEELISEQPYMGVMFKSQNSSTWTADQTQDIKFTLFKAQFDTSTQGLVTFQNVNIEPRNLRANSFETTESSDEIVVHQFNHGLIENSKVIIEGVATGTYNGIPHTELNGEHTVVECDLDTYKIEVTSTATASGKTGGSGARAFVNMPMDIFHPMIQETRLLNTQTAWAARTTSWRHPHGNQQAYIKQASFEPIQVNDNNQFTNPRCIYSDINEEDYMGGNKSFELQGILFSSNPNTSPNIDLQRCSVIVVQNLIDDAEDGNVHNFVDEITGEGGSVKCKYVTKRVTLNEPAISLRIYAGVSKFVENDVELYYKIKPADDTNRFEDIDWTLATVAKGGTSTNDESRFEEWEWDIDELEPFITFAVKIVFRSANPSRIPKMSDFRAICLGT